MILPPIFPTGPEAKILSEIELAVRSGAARALRTRAAVQRQRASDGIAAVGDKFPGLVIRSPEAAMAEKLADAFERLATEIESEGAP